MVAVIILIIILLIAVVITALSASIIVGLVQARGVPFVSTDKKDFDRILTAAGLKPGEMIYDLGCGKGTLLIRAAKKFGAKGIGYEISLWPWLWAQFNIWLSRADVKVYLKNFFKADLSRADVVFCYLFPEVMAKLEPKFQKELQPGSRVVSYSFKLPNLPPAEVVESKDQPHLIKPLATSGKIHVYRF